MRVIFLQDVLNVASAGDIKEVANGFARNYLLPENLATLATQEKLKRITGIKRVAAERRLKEATEWTTLAKALEGITLTLRGLVGPTGQFYGAISVSQILQELTAVTGHKVERRALELPEPLKEPGTYSVTLRLHHDVSAEINVLAEAENPETTTTVQSDLPAATASNPDLPQP